jgi:hypothetical protein
MSRSSAALPLPRKVAGSGRWRRCSTPASTVEPAVSASAASSRMRVLRVLGTALGPDASEHDPLEPQLAVLDLGDVLQFGGQASDASQGRALLAVELVAVVGPEVTPPGYAASPHPCGSRSSSASAEALPANRSDRRVIVALASHGRRRVDQPFRLVGDERAGALLHRGARHPRGAPPPHRRAGRAPGHRRDGGRDLLPRPGRHRHRGPPGAGPRPTDGGDAAGPRLRLGTGRAQRWGCCHQVPTCMPWTSTSAR